MCAASGRRENAADPLRPRDAIRVERDDLERRTVPVDGHQPGAGLARDLELEPRDATVQVLLEVGEKAFDKRMARGEEVDALVFDRVLAIE